MPGPIKFPNEGIGKTGPIVGNGGTGGAGGSGGKALTFPDRPVMPVKVAVFDDTELLKKEEEDRILNEIRKRPGSKPLSFDNVPPVPVKQKPKQVNPTAVFATDDDKGVVKAAVEYVQQNFSSLGCSYDRIEKQIRQLSPLTLEVVMAWGGNAMTENGRMTSEAAKLIKEFVELNSADLMKAALDAARAVPQKKSVFSKFLSNEPTLLELKPRLLILKPQLDAIKPTLTQLITATSEMEKRLMLNVAALSAIVAVVGQPTDDALNRTMDDRRRILTQSANQAKLTNLQLEQQLTLVADQITRLEQLVMVTIPTFEMANATK